MSSVFRRSRKGENFDIDCEPGRFVAAPFDSLQDRFQVEPDASLIGPGNTARCLIIERANRRDIHGMPPLGSNLPS